MQIRLARPQDVKQIRKVSLGLTISANSISPESGFVEYKTPSEKELEQRIKRSKFFYVAEKNKFIIGFCSAYSNKILKELDFSNDEIVNYLLKRYSDFVYWDLLGVKKESQRQRIGTQLIKVFLDAVNKADYKTIMGPISHFPHRNEISIKLLNKLDFFLEGEIAVYNTMKFGIYKKEFT